MAADWDYIDLGSEERVLKLETVLGIGFRNIVFIRFNFSFNYQATNQSKNRREREECC